MFSRYTDSMYYTLVLWMNDIPLYRYATSVYTVSTLDKNLQVLNFQIYKCTFICTVVEVHVSAVHCHMYASSMKGAFMYFTVQYCIEYSCTVSLFQAQDVQKPAEKQ